MFLVFAGYNYYPSGGWEDFVEAFDTFEEAYAAAEVADGDWAHVVNLSTREVTNL